MELTSCAAASSKNCSAPAEVYFSDVDSADECSAFWMNPDNYAMSDYSDSDDEHVLLMKDAFIFDEIRAGNFSK